MKKWYLLSSVLMLLSVSLHSSAQGFNSSYAVFNTGAGDLYYCMPSNTSCGINPALEGASLGQFRAGSTDLVLKGAQVNNYKCSGQDISSVRINYRIYPASSSGGAFTALGLSFQSDVDNGCGGKDQRWENLGAAVNVLSGLTPGNYIIEMYADQSTTAGTQYLSNNSANYKATFTVYREFITTWKTDNPGTSSSTSITIPTTGGGYNYDVDWNNDGVYDELGITGNVTHDFGTAGSYTIRIRGAFPRIYFNNGGDRRKLLDISQWGSIAWSSMGSAFYGCENLNITSTDVPDLNLVTDMSYMFANCPVLNSPSNIGSWNTATVTKMNYLFSYASAFNQPIGNWNTAAVTTMYSMFYYAVAFNQPIGNWNTSAVTTMSVMFAGAYSFNQPIGNWNTSAVANMSTMFQNALSFNQYLGNWTLKSGVVMNFMLNNCGMSCSNYSATLIGWSNNPATPTGRILGAEGRQYSTIAEAARTNLVSVKGWTITGDVASGTNCDPNAFITTWKTDNAGTSNSTSITIPITGTGYNYDVDWNNDGVYDELGITGSVTHNFGTAGTYTIRIRGAFPRIYFNNVGDKAKLLNISQWGSIAWTSMERAFFGCANLNITSADIPDLSGVTNMSLMFATCTSLNGPANIGTWNTATITNMSQLFSNATSFNQSLDVWNTSSVNDMSFLFNGASAFNSSIGNWNTGAVTTMERMFYAATVFNQPIGNWNTAAVTNMSLMFGSATNFNQPIGDWNTAAVTDISNMFSEAHAFDQPIGNWNTERVVNMSYMFYNASAFNQPIGTWNTGAVKYMNYMFYNATSFNQPIGNWNTAAVTTMHRMFYSATSFNQPIGNWNTGAVTMMAQMFYNATHFNQPIGNWNTAAVTNMNDMFYNASAFNQPIGNWNTGAVIYMNDVFYNATAFNQPIGSWSTERVTDMSGMFYNATSFNQPIGNWNIGAVLNMSQMFYNASAFNQNLGTWTLNNNVYMVNMFDNSGMSCANYSATLIGWSKNPLTPSNRNLGTSNRQYNFTGLAARNYLTGTKGWTIGDAGNGATSTLGATAGGAQVCQNADVSLGKMYTDGCNSLVMITPNGTSPVSGTINVCVKIENTVPFYNGEAYLQRHYDITPATNPTTSTARITLYVLQSEFDAFNAANGASQPDLPTGPSDVSGKANLRITQYGGTGTLPGTYSGSTTLIDPADADIVWNGYHWEISFNVTGFSGFYIHAPFYSAPLPVSLLNFSGYNEGGRNVLNWSTGNEESNKGFEVLRSSDGINYTGIGFVNTLADGGNSSRLLDYTFTDAQPTGTVQFYRLRQENHDGRSSWSQVVQIRAGQPAATSIGILSPNPAVNVLNVLITAPARTRLTVLLTDLTGRILAQQPVQVETGNNTIQLNVSGLARGAYLVKLLCTQNDCQSAPARFMKQ